MELDHVGIAVADLEGALEVYARLGLRPGARGRVEAFAVELCFLEAGGARLELLAPTGPGPVQRFLERRGPGLHHLALAVENLEAELARLKAAGVPLVDEVPRPGFGGHRVAFLHPAGGGGVLLELVERR